MLASIIGETVERVSMMFIADFCERTVFALSMETD